MIPYKSIIKIDRSLKQSLFIQISNQIIALIKEGTLPSGSKLPGSRRMSELLAVHRKTVLACYEELNLQGWIEMFPQKGTYVHSELPLMKFQKLEEGVDAKVADKLGFEIRENPLLLSVKASRKKDYMYIDDGICDARLTPTDEIAKIYRNLISKKANLDFLSYDSAHGNPNLRKVLAQYLNETRGLKITDENILVTRGSQMGINLSTQLILRKDDYIIVGETNYQSADITFLNSGAKILRIPVDEEGIKTEFIRELCEQFPVKAIYVTSHHHHPTTVTLSAKRRMSLLRLAKDYRFAILEDDYDYDFHYEHSPILPLASHDQDGNVIYIGSICKLIAPVFRVGYVVGPKCFIDECAKVRRYIDRQGDSLLELTFAHFIKNGNLDRHINKVLKEYRIRRDFFCGLLTSELSEYFQFEVPRGGMAVWVKLKEQYSWEDLSIYADKEKLVIREWQKYDVMQSGHNCMRIGFAYYQLEELKELISRLKRATLGLT